MATVQDAFNLRVFRSQLNAASFQPLIAGRSKQNPLCFKRKNRGIVLNGFLNRVGYRPGFRRTGIRIQIQRVNDRDQIPRSGQADNFCDVSYGLLG